KAAMSEGWPEVRHSDRAFEPVEINGTTVNAIHRYHTSHGQPVRYLNYGGPQLFFSERDAVTAFWARYRRWFSDNTFDVGQQPRMLIWREDPELTEIDGTYSVYARFSCVFETENHELKVA